MGLNAKAENVANIAFEVSFTEPQAHYADVKMTIDNINKNDILVKMPVWAPGSYLIREFSKNVESFKASSGVEKISKNTWKINTKGKKSVTINYRVYCFEVSVRTSFIDDSHAFLSPTGIFMYVDGRLAEPATVSINPFKGWDKVSTGLEKTDGKSFTYYAKNFDWLFDSPIEVGTQDVFDFDVVGVKYEVAMVGGGNYDKERLKTDISKIIEKETDIFGENPNKRYVFIVHNYLSGGGGLEHLNSTVLGATRDGYQNEKIYKSFLGLVAHEHFHLWNVKRLRPIALGPFNYDEENYTTNLWIAEGFTAYYDNLITERAKLINTDEYLDMIQQDINAIENSQGNKVQSLSDASFDAWIKYYRPNENSGNTTVSYYNKGSLIACMLDLAIIKKSEGKQSLDDAMRYAYNEFYKKKNRGYTDAEMKLVFEKYTGENLDTFYADYINGTKSLDFNKYLGYAGLTLVDRTPITKQPYLGITVSKSNKNEIAFVSRNSSAWDSGLNVNDQVLAINGQRTTDVLKDVANLDINKDAEFVVGRDGILKTIIVKFKPSTSKNMVIQEVEKPTDAQKTVLEKWLSL
ncbi:M61 family metallopeptidase [Pedobacter sp. SD-b]|uniref:M61 family metallopeptidase n=2 Tax=Pedobacter segetis TaxID=2793069 RepID=A0ABS1BK81_9SPHI|nr:M61 family metallopeptidase [Pedobacter segetis]